MLFTLHFHEKALLTKNYIIIKVKSQPIRKCQRIRVTSKNPKVTNNQKSLSKTTTLRLKPILKSSNSKIESKTIEDIKSKKQGIFHIYY